jgi:hypothetical protein
VLRYKSTTTGTQLPDRWSLPDELRDDTGVDLRLRLPGLEEMTDEVTRYTTDQVRGSGSTRSSRCSARMLDHEGHGLRRPAAEVERRIHDVSRQLEKRAVRRSTARSCSACSPWATRSSPSMIGARGPEHAGQRACASTTRPSPSPRTGSAPAAAGA